MILIDTITRDNQPEQLLLIHYRAYIENEINIGEARWFTLSAIEDLHKN